MVVLDVIDGSGPIVFEDINLSKSCETDEILTVQLDIAQLALQCDSSSITIVKPSLAGEVAIEENGIFSYNLLSDTFSGTDTVTYEVYCESCETQTVIASVFVEVTCDICEDITVENETFELEACGNVISDALALITGCNSISYSVITPPTQGSFSFNGNNGSFTYQLSNLEFNNTDSVVYEVTCEKDCGSKSTTATIYFDLTNNTLEIPVITKLITPNGDGFNEFLKINNIECYPEHIFKVFNRWGNLIFETDDYANTAEKGWSGQVNKNAGIAPGTFVGDGTYFCVLEFGSGNDISTYVEIRGSNR
jgi:gliding motility-associated-like protein